MNLPPDFIKTVKNTFRADSETWLKELPDLIAEASQRWNLNGICPVAKLSFNFVAFAQRFSSSLERRGRGEGKPVVLKICVPNKELTSEIAALTLYDGQGACRLLEAEPEKGMLLLERLQPGIMLSELEDDEEATHIAAEVMAKLWLSMPEKADNFIQLKDWFKGFQRLRKRFDGGSGPLPKELLEAAESISKEFLAENKDEALLHGDFHHFNVLLSARGWLVIDPKGVIGPRGYEVGPLLINPFDRFLDGSNPRFQTERRVAILSERLTMERERIRNWGICHAVLSAWWSIEDGGEWEYAVRCAEIFQQIRV